MNKIKINLDRPELPSEYIQQKQDFDSISHRSSNFKPAANKRLWFFLCAVVGSLLFVAINFITSKDEKKQMTDKKSASTSPSKKPTVNAKSSPPKIQTIQPEKTINKNKIVPEEIAMHVDDVTPGEKSVNCPTTAVIPKKSGVPTIGGVHSGSIKKAIFLRATKIESGVEGEVTSFMLGYYNGTTEVLEFVNGNILSEKLKNEIITYNLNEIVFLTEILCETADGKQVMLPSMNLKIVP
ncbi:MAG: hypothetical protein LW688_09750 [Cryomorphaceae bacterium]|nr:hypothetical protein [Cryomorphaceae bacterium]